MSNPTGPDREAEPVPGSAEEASTTEQATASDPVAPDEADEPATEVISPAAPQPEPLRTDQPAARRFTAPSGFDAGATEQIDPGPEPATEILAVGDAPAGAAARSAATEQFDPPKTAAPQSIPPRGDPPRALRRKSRSWGWVAALLLVIAALAAVAVLGTVLLTRNSAPKVSQEELVRSTIQSFDVAVQKGDLSTLRTITCGPTRDSYVNYDERAWADTHNRVAAAKQYPVVASIDQVVVNGDHAEANVTTFMAYAPQTRSTRSFDLQFRDEQWKICQASNS